MPQDLPPLTVPDVAAWAQWLACEAATSTGVFLTVAKGTAKDCPTTLIYMQALEEALCYGWIDSQGRKLSESTYGHRFTPRRPDGLWSARNVGFVERLEQEGRLQPAGRAAVAAAKANGRWSKAYAAGGEFPPAFLAAVRANPKAEETFSVLNKTNRFIMYFRMNSLKTKAGLDKRIQAYVDMLARGETPKPQRKRSPSKTSGESATKHRTVRKTRLQISKRG